MATGDEGAVGHVFEANGASGLALELVAGLGHGSTQVFLLNRRLCLPYKVFEL